MNEVLDAIKTLDKTVNFLSENVNSLSERVNSLSGNVNSLSGKVNSLDEKVNFLDQKMIVMQGEISSIKEEMSDMRVEFNGKLEDTKKELLDRQFLFEHEYGEKIKAMYDIMVMTKDKEYDNHKDIEKLDNRLTRAEANIFKQGEDVKVLVQSR